MDHREGQIDVVEDDKKYVVTEGLDEVERQGDIPKPETIRALKGRQMSMIAIGGAIGTGLIIGSGTSLSRSGPGSLLIAYITMGVACLGVMCALGEMSTRYPTKKGFAGHATRCVDEAFGFATALVYLCKYLIASPAQIVAFSLVLRFWNADINGAAWVTCAIVFVVIINMLGVAWFGELEFWFSFIEIVAFTGLILLTLIIDLGGVPGQPRLGFTYWQDGKAFKAYKVAGDLGKFLGFVNALVLALFAYMGCEIVGVTVGEAKNPRKAVPAAIKKTFFRIAFFYIFGVFVVGMAVDSTSKELVAAASAGTKAGAAASPFVVAIKAANIKVVPAIANAALIVFTMSSANSDQYISSRTLYGMALDGHAPKFFTRCTKRGVPWAAFMATSPFMLLAYLVANAGALKIFNYLTSAITLLGGLAWICILSSHIAMQRAMKAQGIPRDSLPWRAPFQPYFSYVSLCFTVVVCFFKGFDSFMPFDAAAFITHYIGFAIFGVGYLGYKFTFGIKSRSLLEVDLVSGGVELIDTPDMDYVDPNLARMSWHARCRYHMVHYLKNW